MPSEQSSGSSRTNIPPLNATTTSSTMASVDSGASFLAEVDAWLVRINKDITELEHRHEKHMSVTGEWWKGRGKPVRSQATKAQVDDESRTARGAA